MTQRLATILFVLAWTVLVLMAGCALLLPNAIANMQGGGGYTLSGEPIPGMVPIGTEFWIEVVEVSSGTAHDVTYAAIVSAYVIWDDGREPHYYILRTDNLFEMNGVNRIRPKSDPVLPPPTIWILNQATMDTFDIPELAE